jgi:hypothetical protein
VEGKGLGNTSIAPGWNAGAGIDYRSCTRVVLGLDATFHYVLSADKTWSKMNRMPDFTAFTAGTHVSFGW